MGDRCGWRVCRAGARGSQVVGSWFFRAASDDGVALSSSLCSCCDLVSRSMIFFCSRTTLVHFFSKRPSYFFAVVASNSFSGRFKSSRSTCALFAWPVDRRYATRDLCLSAHDQRTDWRHKKIGNWTYSSSACRDVRRLLILVSLSIFCPSRCAERGLLSDMADLGEVSVFTSCEG